jgi:hypothetical protein
MTLVVFFITLVLFFIGLPMLVAWLTIVRLNHLRDNLPAEEVESEPTFIAPAAAPQKEAEYCPNSQPLVIDYDDLDQDALRIAAERARMRRIETIDTK